jgi:hypothetical protein
VIQKSVSLDYEPSSEPLHISAKKLSTPGHSSKFHFATPSTCQAVSQRETCPKCWELERFAGGGVAQLRELVPHYLFV